MKNRKVSLCKVAAVAGVALCVGSIVAASLTQAQERRAYNEPYPYYKASGVTAPYQPYPLVGCNEFEIVGSQSTQVCAPRNSVQRVFRVIDKEGHGTAASP